MALAMAMNKTKRKNHEFVLFTSARKKHRTLIKVRLHVMKKPEINLAPSSSSACQQAEKKEKEVPC